MSEQTAPTPAWIVTINSDKDCVAFAPTRDKAKWKAVRAYWDAYGKNGWPTVTARREPRFDRSHLARNPKNQRGVFDRDYVSSTV